MATPAPSAEERERREQLRAKNTTVFGRPVYVYFDDGTHQQMTLRAIRLADYDQALVLVQDEISLVAYCLGKSREFITDEGHAITPECFESLSEAVQEMNQAFVAYCARRIRAQMKLLGVAEKAPSSALPTSSGTSASPPAGA
jgi:hypothetical protein